MNHSKKYQKKLFNLIKLISESDKFNANENSNMSYTFINPYSYLIARKNPDLFLSFDKIFLDGISLVILFKLFGIQVERRSFDMTSIAKDVFEEADKNKRPIAVVGSTDEDLKKFKDFISKKYKNIYWDQLVCGFFKSEPEKLVAANNICQMNPSITIIGMGSGNQEGFAKILIDKKYNGKIYTCGGFIHQTASKNINYYPKIFDKLNIRWIHRIIDEPKLIKRYIKIYPISIITLTYDLILFKLKIKPHDL